VTFTPMLHEILLSLVGHTGDIIIRKLFRDTQSVCGFAVAPDIAFLSSSEKEAINQTCNLGFFYCLIDAFVTSNLRLGVTSLGGVLNEQNGIDNQVGLYVRALSVGLGEILDGYRASILKLEQDILGSSVNFPLSKVHYQLREFFIVLPPLSALVQEITSSNQGPGTGLHGGHLLNYLHKKSLTGVDSVKYTFQRLLFHCHKVFFNQVSSWLVHGLITDPFHEFFVQRIQGAPVLDAHGEHDKELHSNITVPSHDWNSQYTLRLSMLPTAYIPVSVANKMLFIGRAVCILQHPSADSDVHGLLPHSEVVESAQSLHQLRETEHFDLMKVEFEVDRIRSKVSRYLWDLVVLKSDLQGHLLALKDFYLLGRGEFFQCFLDEAAVMMSRPPGPRAARDIHKGPFQTAATKLGLDESPYFKRLSFQMDEASFDFQGFSDADLPKSNVKSGIITLGSASLLGTCIQLSGHTASQAGAAWFTPRQVVEKGFETTFAVQVNANTHSAVDDLGFREGFAFVLQSDGMQSLPVKMANPASSSDTPLVGAIISRASLAHPSLSTSPPLPSLSSPLHSCSPVFYLAAPHFPAPRPPLPLLSLGWTSTQAVRCFFPLQRQCLSLFRSWRRHAPV
jgi:gamma-tubulin complex component 4